MNKFMFFKNAILLTTLLASALTWASTVTIHCRDKKSFTFEDLMESPEVVGTEKCKDHDGYKDFTAVFASERGNMAPPQIEPKKK